MSSIERRIERAERVVGVKDEEPIVFVLSLDFGETAPHFAEPTAKWLTFKRAMAEMRQAHEHACIFQTNPWEEYEARHGLEPGMLAKHELRGKVPFAELLAAATGQNPDQGEQA